MLTVTSRLTPAVSTVARVEADVAHGTTSRARSATRLRVAHAADHERLMPRGRGRAETPDSPCSCTGQADARQRVGLGIGDQNTLLVLAADVALEVDAPDLLVARHEAQRWSNGIAISAVQPSSVDRARRRPRSPSQLRLMLALVPRAAAFAFVEDLLLELRAERRRQEHVAVARIVEGIEDDLEVVFVESGDRQSRRISVATMPDGSDVEGVNAR